MYNDHIFRDITRMESPVYQAVANDGVVMSIDGAGGRSWSIKFLII